MTTQEETILNAEKNEEHSAPNKDGRKNVRWQQVSLGGVTGIAMGAAAMYAVDALASGSKADEGQEAVDAEELGGTQNGGTATGSGQTGVTVSYDDVNMAHVGSGLSFADAFDAARAEVGAGGVFLWHGQLYNTFTADEWAEMTDAQREQFADGVQPYLAQQSAVHTPHQPKEQDPVTPPVPPTPPTPPEPEVHFLGVETMEVEGQTVNIGRITVDDVDVALIDVDNDRVFDVRVTDANQNREADPEEVEDISQHGITVDDYYEMASVLGETSQTEGNAEQAMNAQEDLAPDMPDYMNDVNLDTI